MIRWMTDPARIPVRALWTTHKRPLLLSWLVVILLAAAYGAGMVLLRGPLSFSIWNQVSSMLPWILFLGALAMGHRDLPLYVTYGITRRHFLASATAFIIAAALLSSLLVAGGYAAEYRVYSTLGYSQQLTLPHRFESATQFGPVLVEVGPQLLAFMVSGVAIGASFYKFGTWGGILFLLPAALPMATVLLLAGSMDILVINKASLAAASGITLGVCALGIVISHYVVRDVSIRPE